MSLSPTTYPLLCFDLDDTLVTDNTWYRFNTALGINSARDNELYTAYHDGKLTYEEWLATLLREYQTQVTRDDIMAIFADFTLAPGVREAVTHAQSRGYTLAIITGSFQEAAAAVGKELGIIHTNGVSHCIYDEADVFTDISTSGEEKSAKLQLLTKLTTQLDIPLSQCLALGDSANDTAIFQAVGQAITFTWASTKVTAYADTHIESFYDLIPLL